VHVWDCSSGDVHGLFGYYDALGSVVSDTGIYYSAAPDSVQDGATAKKQSWKITTTANCSATAPFVTPWIPFYNSATSAITPYIECLRDGNATAWTSAEVYAEFSVKTTAGSTKANFSTDWAGFLAAGSAQADGAGPHHDHSDRRCDAGSSDTGHGNGQGFDQTGIGDGQPARQPNDRRLGHEHLVGHPAVSADAERDRGAECTALVVAAGALRALATRGEGFDRHRCAVVEPSGELVAECGPQRERSEQMEIRPADAR
jgi:hypothetical protein